MSKKTQAAATADAEQAEVQASAPATEEVLAEKPTVEQAGDLAAENAAAEEPVRGRALVDLPAHGLKCGEFGSLPEGIARSLEGAGAFDTFAVEN